MPARRNPRCGHVRTRPIYDFGGVALDRAGPDPVNLACLLAALVAAGVLLGANLGGPAGLVLLAAGALLLDIAVQCSQVANQARIFALHPQARSRLKHCAR